MSNRAFYQSSLDSFLTQTAQSIVGEITAKHTQDLKYQQTKAWSAQVRILQASLAQFAGSDSHVYFEFLIPRMGKRADVILIHSGIIFVLEFKVGADKFHRSDARQAHGYALDLKNFHKGSHDKLIVPILVATQGERVTEDPQLKLAQDKVSDPIFADENSLATTIAALSEHYSQTTFHASKWAASGYMPTPTIVEAAQALYANHDVSDIARNEADTQNLAITSQELLSLIHQSRKEKKKTICFVTGVPGAGKTLVGLNIANTHSNPSDNEYSVFLSGNGPLVTVLQQALAIDKSKREKITKAQAKRETSQFIQNIHRFRDDCLDGAIPPEKVAIFDEAQRAWNAEQASKFMQTKRNKPDFNQSEPEFLIEVMDRHQDWAVVIALIGGGQEINTGEAGLAGWLEALSSRFCDWQVYCSDQLLTGDYVSNGVSSQSLARCSILPSLHLATSMRSFRAEKLSSFVHHVVGNSAEQARALSSQLTELYPLKITRDLKLAKRWLIEQARATESKGMLASSNAIRLKAEGIFVKNRFDPESWYLNSQDDIRSCHFLEDVATEFDIQGLELDWCLVGWDGDYRYNGSEFEHWKFKGTNWQRRNKAEDRRYLENAYRVLLTRARQGMILFVPCGDDCDSTRVTKYYDSTYQYLIECGFEPLE
ncbi:DUF2075 domain-containing protein [Vibrio tubiashii]|uniref:DNA/RNA helicase domain-containing protein n=1 Tax=Vibrio tubiashii TaxID=29498 RepID=UPI001EFD95E4|nr:DUF2075 domain-containing protein [Vibrio tubiashii]MCG9574956.1 DUF2075 domain-containing protein [Vibrio tubiashii]